MSENGFGQLGDNDGSDIFYGVGATYNFGNGFVGVGICGVECSAIDSYSGSKLII